MVLKIQIVFLLFILFDVILFYFILLYFFLFFVFYFEEKDSIGKRENQHFLRKESAFPPKP